MAWQDRGLLILGASGRGKSTLALQLVSLGATLVADDRVCLTLSDTGALHMSAPETIAGQIEARHFGILTLPHQPAIATAIADLDTTETDRLPKVHTRSYLRVTLPPAMLLLRMQSLSVAS